MTRLRVWLLASVAGLLVLDGVAPVASEGSDPVSQEGDALDVDRVAEFLGSENPMLSELERRRIAVAVMRYSERYGLDPELVTSVLVAESTARPWARSPKGAVGLMQVMPHMARPMGIAGNLSTIETNIEAGCVILADNIRRLGEKDGISAYFWGSEIRGLGYLRRVQAIRARVKRFARS